MTHWTDRLFREQSDVYSGFFESRLEQADEQAADLLDLLAEEYDATPGSVLDLACGIGRHVAAFSERGLEAEGLDYSEQFVEEGRERLRDSGLDEQASLYRHDLRELDEWTGSYDLVTCFWNSLGYYDRETDERILAEARRLCADGGTFALELGNKDFYVANFESSKVDEDEEYLTVERRDYDVETGRFHTQLDRFDVTAGYEHAHTMEWNNRIYAPPVLRELCERGGFEEVSLFGGFDGSDLSLDSVTVLVLAR